jgi:hypothetical protein
MKLNLPDAIREFFRRQGKIGSKKRMQVLSPEQRQEIARNAAQARWSKREEKQSRKPQQPATGGKQR